MHTWKLSKDFTVTQEQFWNEKQSVHFKGLYQTKTHPFLRSPYTLRVDIKIDSHLPQSFAKVFNFSIEIGQWVLLHSIPYPLMKCKDVYSYRVVDWSGLGLIDGEYKSINQDVDELLSVAKTLLCL